MSRLFGNFIEQAEAEQEDPKAKRLKMIKRQVLQKKVQAVRQGAGEDIVASYELEGEMVEGLKQARKNVGASSCWKGYKAKGTKMKGGKSVPNCVKEEEVDEGKKGLWDNIHAKRKRGEKPAKKGDKDYPKTLNVEAKVDQGRSDYGKASIRNYRRSGPGHGEPAMFDSENKRGKTIDKRREEHKERRGVKGAKVPAYKVEGYQRNPERDTRSARQKRMDDPDTGINSAKFREFMAAQQKPSKPKKKVQEELSRRDKPSAKAKMAKLDAILQRREEKKVSEKLKTEGVLTAIGRKKKTVEKKPQKAMDAGARGRRMLKRREHAKYVSGSEDNVPDEMREGVGSAVKAVGKAAGKAVGFAAKSAAGVVGHGVNALNQPGYKPKPKTGSTGNKSAGLSAAQSQAEKANKARLDARKKAIVKIKDDRRERATNIMTAEKAAKKVKKEGEDKKFKADSEKPIVAELHDIVKSRKKKAKCSK